MSFKELLEKNIAGTATKEEQELVEAEIEKNEAINEYLSEQIAEAIPKIGINTPIPNNIAESTKIRKRINRKFAGVVAISVSVIIAIFCIIHYAIFPFINSRYYNPLDGHKSVNGTNELGQMSIDMSVFSELHLRGYEIPFVFAKPYGLGKYDLTIYQYDSFRNFSETQYRDSIVRGRLTQSAFSDATIRGLGLNWIHLEYGQYSDWGSAVNVINDASRAELLRLPESAQVKAYLSFAEMMNMQTLSEFVKESEARVLWAGVKCSDSEIFMDGRFGFSPLGKYIPLNHISRNAYDTQLYPLLELDESESWGGTDIIDFDKLSAAAYETHFVSMLKYMSDREEFLDIIGFAYDYTAALSYVQQNGIMCHGIVVAGNRDTIERLATNPMVQYITIDDVTVSAFSRD